MSNRRPAQVPPVVRAALAWRCPDCSSENGRPWRDPRGVWHLPVSHDPTCPALAGRIPMPALYLDLRSTL
jgi:hypothetical protein